MTLHIVGGFLGSGKTTAIIAAARRLIECGVSVLIVTNDQGSNLVDTAVVQEARIDVREVTGGCFCCNLPSFQQMLSALMEETAQKVVFAEPVGSCTDLVATVVKPLAGQDPPIRIGSLSVLTDIRLFRQRLYGRPLPFSPDVCYIYDKQLEEASFLILNKADLVPQESARETLTRACERYSEKSVLLQNSLDPRGVDAWLNAISKKHRQFLRSLPVDYQRYAAAEMGLAWYDASIAIDLPAETGREAVRRLLEELQSATAERGRLAAHVKLFVRHESGAFTTSLTSADDELPIIPTCAGRHIDILINVRVEDEPAKLLKVMRVAASRAFAQLKTAWSIENEYCFHPAEPAPYLRVP